jgi:N-acetylglucosaminyldiphosphoundecaprenol N-acetyl-beta-D-mannosaminyltransferase
VKRSNNNQVFRFDGYTLVVRSLEAAPLDGRCVINTVSPNSYGISVRDKDMDKALRGSDFLILDGVYFGWLPLFKHGRKIKRITGWDSFRFFSQKMQACGGRVFFLGSSEATLQRIKERYSGEFPAVTVETYSPPFKPEFSADDDRAMHKAVNAFRPDVLFVGMTAPKQEKWAYRNKDFLDVHVISTVGNVFDWYAGNSKRPNVFWQKIGMEWLVRIFLRPEIFRRNIKNQMIFFLHLFLYIIKIKKTW